AGGAVTIAETAATPAPAPMINRRLGARPSCKSSMFAYRWGPPIELRDFEPGSLAPAGARSDSIREADRPAYSAAKRASGAGPAWGAPQRASTSRRSRIGGN